MSNTEATYELLIEQPMYMEFDIFKHKESFVNYLEVIILPNGKVEYAVPSHQEKLTHIGMEKYHMTKKEFQSMCPRIYWFDCLTWLCNMTNIICVWNDRMVGTPNRFQRHKLQELKRAGLYKGDIN